MPPKKLLLGVCWLPALLLAGCTTWHNPATGETRSSVPIYPECQKREMAPDVDKYCLRTCLDRQKALRGTRNAAVCEQECGNKEGRVLIFDDDACNAQKTRQEGWVNK